jgi:type II secretory pathway component PulF
LVTGATTADTQEDAVRTIKDMGYTPISIQETRAVIPNVMFNWFKRVKPTELLAFTRQFYSMEKSGIPILASLESLAQEIKNKYFSLVLNQIVHDIKGGSSLSSALSKHGNVFDSIYIGMIKAAEGAGKIDEVLGRLTELIEHEIEIDAQIKAVTRYPKIVLAVLCVGFLILVTFVIPKFAAIYGQFNTPLPLPTRILIGTYAVLKKYWYLFIIVFAGIIYGFISYIKTKKGREKWDMFKIRVPVFGKIILMLVMSRFSRITALLIKSGVPILELLELSSAAVGNVVISKAVIDIRDSVNQGKGMSSPMKASGLFPSTIIQMVAIGEQSGRVDELLMSVSDYYDRESNYIVKNLITYIEPILICVLAIMVLIMVLGIYMPMWNLIKVYQPS